MIKIDHVILGVDCLEVGIKKFHELTGVKPEFSGRHRSLGTHNALVSLTRAKPGPYFELLANDPHPLVVVPQENQVQGLLELKGQKLIAWCLGCDDFQEIKKSLQPFSLSLSEIGSGERVNDQGACLKYEFAKIEGLDHLGMAVPFIIRWLQETVHPSLTTPQGCDLKKLSITHEKSEVFSKWMASLNLGIDLKEGTPHIAIEMNTPKGSVHF